MRCVSPWYNRTGWLDVKHQLTYLLLDTAIDAPVFLDIFIIIIDHFYIPLSSRLTVLACDSTWVNSFL